MAGLFDLLQGIFGSPAQGDVQIAAQPDGPLAQLMMGAGNPDLDDLLKRLATQNGMLGTNDVTTSRPANGIGQWQTEVIPENTSRPGPLPPRPAPPNWGTPIPTGPVDAQTQTSPAPVYRTAGETVATKTQDRLPMAVAPSAAKVQARQPDFMDRLGALSRGYDKGGLLGGIADGFGGVDRSIAKENQTLNWLMKQPNMDADTARLVASNPALIQQILTNRLAPKEMTNDVREYNLARQQGYGGSFLDYQKELKAAGRSQVNIDQRAENEENKEFGKAAGQAAAKVMSDATASQGSLRSLAQTKELMRRIPTGATAGVKLQAARWAQDLGVSPETLEAMGIPKNFVGDAQALQAQVARSTVDMIGKGGFPANNFSNADREFLERTVPQLSNDPRGNELIVEIAERMSRANIDKAQALQQWRSKNPGKSFYDFDAEYAQSVPNRFDDIKNALSAPSNGASLGTTAAPTLGTGYRVLGVR